MPDVYIHGLPPCVLNSTCKEGRLTCGKMSQAIETYSKYIKK